MRLARKPKISRVRKARQDRALGTVDTILRATAHVLVRDGYDKASTNRIAERAGVSIGSIYQYFPNKEALFGALVERHLEEMRGVLVSTFADVLSKPFPEAVRAFVLAMIRAHAVDPALHRVLIEQLPRVGSLALARVRDVEADAITLVKTYLARLAESTSLVLPKDLDVAAFLAVTTVEAATHKAVLHERDLLARPSFVDELVDMVVRYLLRDEAAEKLRAPTATAPKISAPRRRRAS